MTIKVFIDSIDQSDLEKIIGYYNNNISPDQPKLEILDRAEGGFQIKINEKEHEHDSNKKIKQLRWQKKHLLPYKNYIGFDKSEEIMLFNAMYSVLGNHVLME